MSIKCRLIGCVLARDYPACARCQSQLYEDFRDSGALEPLLSAYWKVRRAIRKMGPKRCGECKKLYWRGYDEYTCSDECFTNWLPF